MVRQSSEDFLERNKHLPGDGDAVAAKNLAPPLTVFRIIAALDVLVCGGRGSRLQQPERGVSLAGRNYRKSSTASVQPEPTPLSREWTR